MASDFLLSWQSQVRKGYLSLLVLNLISRSENYGYELLEELRSKAGLDVAEGTLYPLLVRLKKEGLIDSKWVEQESGIPRKYYTLTREGEKILAEMNAAWKELNQAVKKTR